MPSSARVPGSGVATADSVQVPALEPTLRNTLLLALTASSASVTDPLFLVIMKIPLPLTKKSQANKGLGSARPSMPPRVELRSVRV